MNSSRGWWTSGARVTFVHGRRLKERVLQIPRGFDLFQWLVGAPASKRRFVTEHVRANPGDRILDLGCYIRTVDRYVDPMRELFASVSSEVMVTGYRIPFSMVILEAHH